MNFTHEREFTYTRAYRGPIRCVILDWAGTTMDFGCMAPAVVFHAGVRKSRCTHQHRRSPYPHGGA